MKAPKTVAIMRSQYLRSVVLLLLLGAALLLPPLVAQAQGQTPAIPTIEQIVADNEATPGLAETIMEGLLGTSFEDPFIPGAPTTLFGAIFFAFNAFVFAVAVAWGTYGVVAGIVQTAHEGVVLGKRLNALWVPVRTVTGIGSLVPIFGGFGLSQAVMIMALGWGIAGANYVTRVGIDALANFIPMTVPSAIQGSPSSSARDLTFNLFMQELCILGHARAARQNQNLGLTPPSSAVLVDNSANFLTIARASGAGSLSAQGVGSAWGTSSDPTACLSVGIIRNDYDAPGINENAIFGRQLRNYTVDYEAIATQTYTRYAAAFQRLNHEVRGLARAYAQSYDTFLASNGGSADMTPMIPTEALMQASARFSLMDAGQGGQQNEQSQAAAMTAVRENALQQVEGLGFLSLGMYHSMISEANTALNAAKNAIVFHISEPSGLFSPESDVIQSHYIAAALRSADRTGFSGVGPAASQDFNDLLNYNHPSGSEESIWKTNMGQKIVNVALGALITGNQEAGINNMSLIDPIISAKNVGDYMMTAGTTLILLPEVVTRTGSVIAKGVAYVGKAASVIPGMQKKGAIGAGAGHTASAVLEYASPIGWVLLIVGAILAIYIPFVPFLNWVSAMVQYVATVVQAFVAAPIWSLAHMEMEGEGMGSRSERGYIWVLFVLFKPVLMVIAFFAATGMVILIGSVVTWIYLPVVANVQGNSVTGIASIVFFILLYFILLNIIIQGSFNLVEEISDDAIGWIGGVNRSNVGKGMDTQVAGVFVGSGIKGARAEAMALARPRPQKT